MQAFGEVAERLRRSTVQVFPHGHSRGGGSGVVWTADGLIVTNAHVARSRDAEVELWDGRRFRASVAARDPRRDLATLRLVCPTGGVTGLETATAGDSDGLRAGWP